MGKSRRNRGGKGHRKDPIAKTVKPPSDPELAALREKSILPVIKDLQSSEPASRTAAASAVSNLVTDERCRKLLLREQIVHIVLDETLTDSGIESRAAGWDILRVLAEEEEADFCVHLYRQDILSALGFASQSILESLTKSSDLSKGELKFTWATAESVVALLSALAEAQDEILEAIVAIQAIKSLLFAIISRQDTPTSVCLDALSALLTLTEDNKRISWNIASDKSPNPLQELTRLSISNGARAVLACGVMHNVFSSLEWFDGLVGRASPSDHTLIPTLAMALQEYKPDSDLPPQSQWSDPTEVLQLVLEILADIGTTLQQQIQAGSKQANSKKDGGKGNQVGDDTAMDEDEDEDEDEDDEDREKGSDDEENAGDDDSDAEMDDDAMQADMEMVTGADDDVEDHPDLEDLPTLRNLLLVGVPELIKLANPSSQSEAAVRLQGHALNALGNIAWSISVFDLSDKYNKCILKEWTPSGEAIWSKVIVPILAANTADIGLATQVTSLAWAVSRSLPGRVPLAGDEHKKFMALYQATKTLLLQDGGNGGGTNGEKPKDKEEPEDPFKGLGVKCVGVLGQLARDPAPIALNREIGVFLITVVTSLPDTPAADAVEALNQLFDIYGDEELPCDKEVFWKDNFLQHLDAAQPNMKALVKTIDKRASPELRTRADEAVMNLARFIRYKKKNQP